VDANIEYLEEAALNSDSLPHLKSSEEASKGEEASYVSDMHLGPTIKSFGFQLPIGFADRRDFLVSFEVGSYRG